MHISFEQIISLLEHYRYLIIIPLGIAEGPILGVLCGLLVKLKYLEFWPTYLILISADLIGDVVWYLVGRFGTHKLVKRYGHIFSLNDKVMGKLENKFRAHQNKTLLISKMTSGFGFALVTLMIAGMLKIDFKKYMIINIIGGFFWTGVLLLAGYSFGNLYKQIDEGFRIAFTAGFVLIVFGLLYGMQKYFRQKTLTEK